MKKRRKTIVALAISLVACLSVLGATAYAWFSMNKGVNTSAMNTRIESFEAQAEYTVYLFDSKAGEVNYTGKNGDETDPTIMALDVPFYDTIFKQRNRYTPVVIRIALSGVKLPEGTVIIKLDRNTALSRPDGSGYFTDLMRFTIVKGTSFYDEDADELYENVDGTLFPLLENDSYTEDSIDNRTLFKGPSKVFDTRDYENASQGNTEDYDYITLSLPYGAADFVDGVFNVYVYITYDEDLVDSFSGFGNVTTIGHWVDMINDISRMEIAFTPND